MGFYYKAVPDDTYCLIGYRGSDAHIEFPTNMTITILGDNLFRGHTEIESVNIPDSVTQIGGFVFDGCTRLRSLRLPPDLADMWQYAMTRTALEEIEIPGSVQAIIPFTFFQSESLKKVHIHEGTRRIDAWAFKECTALTDVYLESSRIEISDKAFENCGEIAFHRV